MCACFLLLLKHIPFLDSIQWHTTRSEWHFSNEITQFMSICNNFFAAFSGEPYALQHNKIEPINQPPVPAATRLNRRHRRFAVNRYKSICVSRVGVVTSSSYTHASHTSRIEFFMTALCALIALTAAWTIPFFLVHPFPFTPVVAVAFCF